MRAEYIDHMGDDLSIVNSARVSFAKKSEALSDADIRLIKYLAQYDHWTPFAHTSITLRMRAPIPVRTQCFKHKQGFVENEESRRYITDTPDFYVPDFFRPAHESKKQGSRDEKHERNAPLLAIYRASMARSLLHYNAMIAAGVCPEQARFVLPQGVLTEWVWTGSLAAYARFCSQRMAPDAQKEVRQLAKMVADIIEPLYPHSWAALMNKEEQG